MPTQTADVPTINERASEEFFGRAEAAEQAGHHAKAVDFYERSLGENPDHEAACFNLAVLYDRRGEDAKAIELYERVCSGGPVPINALMNLAVLYEDNGFYEEARQCLEMTLKVQPNHERARLYLKDVLSAHAASAEEDAQRQSRRNTVLDTLVGEFELSVRSRNCLKKMNIITLGDLLRVGEQELLSFKNFGETSLNEIKSLLASKGFRLGQFADVDADTSALDLSDLLAGTAGPTEGDGAVDASFGADLAGPSATTADEELPGELTERQVGDLELSVRSRKALQRLNINTVAELMDRTEDELLSCKNFGLTSLQEIKTVLASLGLQLRRA